MGIGSSLLVGLAVGVAASTLAGAEATGQPTETLTIEQAVIAREVENREPVDEATSFPADVGQLVFFTRGVGAGEETYIYHVWRHGETERARVRLPVRSPSWRTWSTKQIQSSWTGSWTVQVLDAHGEALDTLSFTIQGAGNGSAGAD